MNLNDLYPESNSDMLNGSRVNKIGTIYEQISYKGFLMIETGIRLDPMLLLLSHFSHVQLCATPETVAHQDPPSLGFSRKEHWSGLPFPSPMHENEK